MIENVGIRIKEIGIAIWGCKGGYRIFCNNNVIDVKVPIIRNTLKDIRSFIRFNAGGVDFYALEFTDAYKVYTIYRSSNDSNGSSGAFIAVTVFVPHSLSVSNVRTLLEEIINAYFKEYIHPIFLSPLDGKYDNIAPFVKILDKYKQDIFPENMKYVRNISTQDDIPQVLCYSDISLVDKYFATPYRKQFYACQEVMFLEDRICANLDKYGVVFGVPPIYIDEVSEPECSCLLPVDSLENGIIFEIKINDEKLNLEEDNPLSDKDNISIVAKKDYYESYSFSGTVEKAINEKVLERNEQNYKLTTNKIKLEPNKYSLEIIFENDDLSNSLKSSLQYRLIAKDNKSSIYYSTYKDAGLFFKFKGDEIAKEYIVSVRICNVGTNENNKIYADFSNSVIPVNLLGTELKGAIKELGIQVHNFQLTEKSSEGFSVDCIVKASRGEYYFSFLVNKKKNLKLFFPRSEAYDNIDSSFKSSSCEVKQDKKDGCNYLTFSPSTVRVGVRIPENVLSHLSVQVKFSCFLKDEKKEIIALYDEKNKGYYFEFPYQSWTGILKFYINEDLYECIIKDNLIIPNILFVTATNDTVKCRIKMGDEDKGSVTASAPILLPLKDGTDVSLIDEDNYWAEKTDVDEYCRIITINRKNSDKSSSEAVQATPTPDDNKVKDNVTFKNCEGYYFINKDGDTLELKGSDKKITTQSTLVIYRKLCRFTKRYELVCTIPFPKNKYCEAKIDEKNKNAGFNITWNEDGKGYHIERKKKKNKPLISVLVLFVLLAAAGIFFYYSCIKEVKPVCIIILKTGEGTSIKEVTLDNFDNTLTPKEAHNKDTVTIELYAKPNIEKESIAEKLKNASVQITFKDEGDSIYFLKDCSSLSNKGKEPLNLECNILTPGKVAVTQLPMSFRKMNDSLTINNGEELKGKYPRYKSNFEELIWENIDQKDTTSLLYFLEYVDEGDLKNQVDSILDGIRAIEGKCNDFLKILSKLERNDCDSCTITEIREAYDKLDDSVKNAVGEKEAGKNLYLKLNCYERFFKADKPDVLYKEKDSNSLINKTSVFTPLQLNIMKFCYGANTKCFSDRFNTLKKDVGMNFQKALDYAIDKSWVKYKYKDGKITDLSNAGPK